MLIFTITVYSYGCEYMKTIWRCFLFECKMAFKNFFRYFGLSLSAMMSVTVTLVLISIFLIITANLGNVTYHMEDEIIIRATIDQVLEKTQIDTLKNKIKLLENVKDIQYFTGAEELAEYKKEYTDEQSLFSMYDGDTNPIRDSFIIEIKDHNLIASTSEQLLEIDGIVDVNYGGDTTNAMIASFQVIQTGSLGFICLLMFIAIFLIVNKIKMSIYTRKSEIAIMRFVGASNWCIRFPMLIEGMGIGLFGSVLPICMTVYGYQFFYTALHGVAVSDMFQLIPVIPFVIYISVLLVVIGMVVGILGSYISTSKYLKWKR